MFRTHITVFSFGADLTNICLVEGFVDENALVEGFVNKNMVFDDYMSEYLSDGDEK